MAQKPSRMSLRQLIWVCLGVMTVVFLAVSAVSMLERFTVAHAVGQLSDKVAPIQADVAALRRAYTDHRPARVHAHRQPGLPRPLNSGIASADRLVPELRDKLADDASALKELDSTVALASTWRTQAAEPQIAARRGGRVTPEQLEDFALEGKQLFDAVREQQRNLADYIDGMSAVQLQPIEAAQKVADVIQIVGAVLLLAVVGGALLAVQRCLTRPVNTMLDEVRAVANGDYDQPIRPAGPREIAQLAEAVEQMRESLRTSIDRLIDGEVRDEQARIATDLHDRVIQRVFGLG